MSTRRPHASVRAASQLATLTLGAVAVMQLLFALGVLPVTMAWGGRQEVLTPGLRGAHVASACVLVGFVWIIRRRAEGGPAPVWLRVLTWCIGGFLLLNTVGNIASASALERLVFTPLSAAAAVATPFVAVVARRQVAPASDA